MKGRVENIIIIKACSPLKLLDEMVTDFNISIAQITDNHVGFLNFSPIPG